MKEEKLRQLKILIEEILSIVESDLNKEDLSEFKILSDILNSSRWPEAVCAALIADEDSEQDKEERAQGINSIMLPPTAKKSFLDFGCGEGHVAKYVSTEASLSVGYDIFRNPKSKLEWENKKDKLLLTTDFNKVVSEGPYDIILIYDVLDHSQDPKEVLFKAKSVLADDGRIYVRTHPWTSRHGGHVYRKINKAFIHLVFTEEELKSMGVELEYNVKSMRPIDNFNLWLEGSGLKNSLEPELDQQEVEPFFKENPIIRKRILDSFGIKEWTEGLPEWQMRQCFWDYVLEKDAN